MKLIQKFMLLLCALSASMVFVGCDEECFESDEGGVCVDTYEDGYYYDNLVTGLTYENRNEAGDVMRTAVTGEGDDPGRFRFLEGQTVAFSLGLTDLGEAAAKARLTPFDIALVEEAAVGTADGTCAVDTAQLPGDEEDFRIVHNLAVLLQTMDTDGDHATGIDIDPGVAALFADVSIEVNQPWSTFDTDDDLLAVLGTANEQSLFTDSDPEDRTVRTTKEALEALYQGLGLCDGTGGTGGTGGAGGTGGSGGTGGTGG